MLSSGWGGIGDLHVRGDVKIKSRKESGSSLGLWGKNAEWQRRREGKSHSRQRTPLA